jgi:hypothetical protein
MKTILKGRSRIQKGVVLVCVAITPLIFSGFSGTEPKKVVESGMTISWRYEGNRVFFEMQAPTTGWVAIGFNKGESITGTWWLMGRVVNGRAEVVEHYTVSPGNYPTVTSLGEQPQVAAVQGSETNSTQLSFSLPLVAGHRYAQSLAAGTPLVMHIAYSREDDFKHHSMMRTTVLIKL